jgi:hypothetical protein
MDLTLPQIAAKAQQLEGHDRQATLYTQRGEIL